MIGYVTLGTNELERAIAFYDALFEGMRIGRIMEKEGHFVAWAKSMHEPSVCVTKPFDGRVATVGNGVMIALRQPTPADVDALHRRALELGAHCEGPPGPRAAGFYVGYFRDLDGHKLNVFCTEPAPQA